MVRSYLLIVFILLCCSGLNAQLTYGGKAGLNLSSMNFSSDSYKTSVKPGIYIGVLANYQLNDKMAVQAELFYSMEGVKEKLKNSSTDGHITNSYLRLPLLFQYSFIPSWYAETGVEFGFLLAAKETFGSTKNNDIKKYYKTTDLHVPIGIGYHIAAVQGLTVNARYSYGLSATPKVSVGGGDLKNRTFSIGAQYTMGKKQLHKK